MILLEKPLIGAYGNRLYGLGKRYAKAESKQTGKNLNVTNINAKEGPPNHQKGLPINSSFF